ncbi:MAG TPA: DUF1045 domain-containing protein [Acetobacteraceae bacterium]|jgi:hypothetical protein
MSRDIRVALYYAPASDDPLFRLSSVWLGRDPESNAPCSQPDIPGIAQVTAEPAGYGFHATLKPPMRLRPGVSLDDVREATANIAAAIPAFDLPRLAVTDLRGFLALCETSPSPELQAMSDVCVAGLDHLREPPDEAELAKRRRYGLPPAQDANLLRWGYPHVFATWFFHMTLTRRLNPEEKAIFEPAAADYFAGAVVLPRRVADICLFTQPAPGVPFTIAERIPLRG